MRSDLAGQRFGRLVAVEPTDERKGGSVVWRCRCDCGNECLASAAVLKRGYATSCGCSRKPDVRSGSSFGDLAVLDRARSAGSSHALWLCECSCGRRVVLRTRDLLSLGRRDCGRMHAKPTSGHRRELAGQRFGRLLALRETRLRGYVAYACLCDCGRRVTVRAEDLESGAKRECAPFDHGLIGERFGRLVVKGYAGSAGKEGAIMACLCDCGRDCEVLASSLKKGNTRSCGCGEYDNRAKNMRAHSERIHVDGTNLATIGGKTRSDNTSGTTGVFLVKKSGRWRATITFQGRTRSLGTYERKEDAVAARKEAEARYFEPVLERHGKSGAGGA